MSLSSYAQSVASKLAVDHDDYDDGQYFVLTT